MLAIDCRYPGQVASATSFFDCMQSSANLQAGVPLERWDSEALLSIGAAVDKIYANSAAAMSDSVADFDTALFGMSKAEASATDPQVTSFPLHQDSYPCSACEDSKC